MRRVYVNGQRNRRIKAGADGTVAVPVGALTVGEVHHLMVVDLPLWRVAWGWVRWATWYRWVP